MHAERPEDVVHTFGAGAATVQRDLFCSACHSMEPGAHTGFGGLRLTHERLKAISGKLVDPKIKEHRGRTVKNTATGCSSSSRA